MSPPADRQTSVSSRVVSSRAARSTAQPLTTPLGSKRRRPFGPGRWTENALADCCSAARASATTSATSDGESASRSRGDGPTRSGRQVRGVPGQGDPSRRGDGAEAALRVLCRKGLRRGLDSRAVAAGSVEPGESLRRGERIAGAPPTCQRQPKTDPWRRGGFHRLSQHRWSEGE